MPHAKALSVKWDARWASLLWKILLLKGFLNTSLSTEFVTKLGVRTDSERVNIVFIKTTFELQQSVTRLEVPSISS